MDTDERLTVSLREHYDALRVADERLLAERDRRYAEVAAARAEALRIKEEGDRRALELARDIQAYKDERDNRLREQITSERGLYVTHAELSVVVEKFEALIDPISKYISGQQGRRGGIQASTGALVTIIVVAVAVIQLIIRLVPIGT